MGVTIHPCRMCPLRKDCEIRADFRRRASKSGAVSITYRCDRLRFHLRPGRRIIVLVPHIRGYRRDDGSAQYERIGARATITNVTESYLFSCVVDPEDGPDPQTDEGPAYYEPSLVRFRRKRKHSSIVRFLDEPDLPLCKDGSCVQRDGVCDAPRGVCVCADNRRIAEQFANV